MGEAKFGIRDWVRNTYTDDVFQVLGIELIDHIFWYVSYENESEKVVVNEKYLERVKEEQK